MSTPILIYLSHPVGAPDRVELEAVLGQARQWVRYLLGLPDPACRRIAWCAPWVAYVDSLRDDVVQYRERGARDCDAALERCDGLVAIGRTTPWRERELATADRMALPVVNLCSRGPLPPPTGTANWWAERPNREILAELVALVSHVDRRRAARSVQP